MKDRVVFPQPTIRILNDGPGSELVPLISLCCAALRTTGSLCTTSRCAMASVLIRVHTRRSAFDTGQDHKKSPHTCVLKQVCRECARIDTNVRHSVFGDCSLVGRVSRMRSTVHLAPLHSPNNECYLTEQTHHSLQPHLLMLFRRGKQAGWQAGTQLGRQAGKPVSRAVDAGQGTRSVQVLNQQPDTNTFTVKTKPDTQTHRHTDTQTHRHTDTQTHRRHRTRSSSLITDNRLLEYRLPTTTTITSNRQLSYPCTRALPSAVPCLTLGPTDQWTNRRRTGTNDGRTTDGRTDCQTPQSVCFLHSVCSPCFGAPRQPIRRSALSREVGASVRRLRSSGSE